MRKPMNSLQFIIEVFYQLREIFFKLYIGYIKMKARKSLLKISKNDIEGLFRNTTY